MSAIKKIEFKVMSEFETLKVVLTHEPGPEISRLSPSNKKNLLFEDVPYLPHMKREHQQFTSLLKSQGVEVLDLRTLLVDLLTQDRNACTRLIIKSCNASLVPGLAQSLLDKTPGEMVDALFGGVTAIEARVISSSSRHDYFVMPPIPNAYFMRDPAAVVGDSLISCKMHHVPRIRESLIVRELLRSHPIFAKPKILYGDDTECGEDRPYTLEGGDIIVLNKRSIFVGLSERTRLESIRRLATTLFRAGIVSRVYVIAIPHERAYMHLDTVFTIAGPEVVVTYPEVMEKAIEIRRYEPINIQNNEGPDIFATEVYETRLLNDVLKEELGNFTVVETGDGNILDAEREQAADGTNVLAIAPNIVVTYDRNDSTNRALERVGLKVLTIPGAELVRGLGGPRCMTMPLIRG